MKSITITEFRKKILLCTEISQKEHVVVTRHGRPAAVVIGVDGRDWEDVLYQTSPAFWKMIETRCCEKSIPASEMRKRLEARWAGAKRKKR